MEIVPERPVEPLDTGRYARKLALMDAVQSLIEHSRVATAKLWNPYKELTDVDVTTIKAPPAEVPLPATIPDTVTSIGSLNRLERRKFGLEKAESDAPTTVSDGEFEAERERRRREYVQWGKDHVRGFFSGNCSWFAAVTLGLLASGEGLTALPADAVVELFGFSSSDGHAFLVVNRRGGDLDKPATWGPDAFAVDQWFARQRAGTPGRYAVKDVTGKAGDKYFDAAFNTFISVPMRGPTSFTHGLLSDPRNPT